MTTVAWAPTAYRVPDWLASDTEESVVGTQWHQTAISTTTDLLEEAARRHEAGWGVCDQIALQGLLHDDGSPYDPRPDILVLPGRLPSGSMASIHLEQAGVPLLVVEVASTSTAAQDMGEKRRAYEAIGAAEYLAFDPNGGLLPAPLQGWRLAGGVYVPWGPEPDGWWASATLGVAFRPARPLLEVRDRDGQRIEPSREVRQRAQQLEQRSGQLEQRAGQLEQRAGQLEGRLGETTRQLTEAERQLAQAVRRVAELEEENRRLRGQDS